MIIIGDENYGPKFGYKKSSKFGISFPPEVPEENGTAKIW
ncbi:putative N-acetyltransferase YhbS [Chryseobacterium sp. H1D6B]|nr:putative N-acetyltransferase YhbS [Chryseobacterium sp. H1D6B]